jgi:tellurite resistance protein TerC
MLVEIVHVKVPVYVSLLVIVLCLGGSILYSIQANEKDDEEPLTEKQE